MKWNFLSLGLLTLAAWTSVGTQADAFFGPLKRIRCWCHDRHNTLRIHVSPYNAFTPFCAGNLHCHGTCPSPCAAALGHVDPGAGAVRGWHFRHRFSGHCSPGVCNMNAGDCCGDGHVMNGQMPIPAAAYAYYGNGMHLMNAQQAQVPQMPQMNYPVAFYPGYGYGYMVPASYNPYAWNPWAAAAAYQQTGYQGQ